MLTHRAEIRRAFLGRDVIPPFFSDEWISEHFCWLIYRLHQLTVISFPLAITPSWRQWTGGEPRSREVVLEKMRRKEWQKSSQFGRVAGCHIATTFSFWDPLFLGLTSANVSFHQDRDFGAWTHSADNLKETWKKTLKIAGVKILSEN